MPEKQYTEKLLTELLERNPNILVFDSDAHVGRGLYQFQEFDPRDTKREDPLVTISIMEEKKFINPISTVLICHFGGFESRIVIKDGEPSFYGYEHENPSHIFEIAKQGLEILNVYKRLELDPERYKNQIVSRRDVDDVYEVGLEEDPIERMLENLEKALGSR